MKMLKTIFHITLVSVAVGFSSGSMADHSWGKYKWKPSSIPFNLDLGDNVNSDWDGHLLIASTDWSVSTVLDTTVISGSTNPAACSPESGNVQVCNDSYGNNGWLGIAQIYGRGTTITAGLVKLNDTYFNTATYNTPAWRQMVMCQEIGHTFGLDHQDENFSNANLDTCMDYTSSPGSNQHPNQHDYDQLESIYAGGKDDGDSGGSCNPRSPKCNPASAPGNSANSHAQWGQLVSRRGGKEVYELDLGSGYRVVTFVTRTLEYTESKRH